MDLNNKSFATWLKKSGGKLQTISYVLSVGSGDGVNLKLIEAARVELNKMLEIPGNNEPVRGSLEDPTVEWRSKKPDYTLANLAFLKGKTKSHAIGSLEMIVENVVKTVNKVSLIAVTSE